MSQMKKRFPWQAVGVSTLIFSILGLYACPGVQPMSGAAPTSSEATIPVAQNPSTDTAIVEFSAQTVAFEICGDSPDWQRLELSEQTDALMANPRYGEALTEEPLKGLFEKFWNESVITFTTYGLSARTEPIYLSGVWTGIEAMEACYEGDRPEAINQGELAEIWLIGHRILDITWTGSTYQISVESSATGLQFVQFKRIEEKATLPIVVIENGGNEVTVASGDW
jgi:hypothetical protein